MKALSLSLIILCMASLVQAGTVVLSTSGGKRFATSNGLSLPVGSAVRVGTFLLPDATRDETLASTGDYATLKGWFKPLAEGSIGGGTLSQIEGSGTVLRSNGYPAAGDLFGSIEGINTTYIAPGTKLYVWVFNSPTPDTCTQWGIYCAGTWSAPQSMGVTALSTTGAVESLQGETTATKLLLSPPANTYGNWTWQAYSLTALPTTTSPTADPDHDGLANLAEYAWKLNPSARDGAQTQLAANAGGSVSFTFKAPKGAPEVSVIAECSMDLTNWFPAPSTVVATDADFDTRVSTAAPGQRCFWRVRFEPITQ